jgi:hypothetical protein
MVNHHHHHHRCHPQFIIMAIIYGFFHHRHHLHFFTCLLREVCFTKLTYFRTNCRQIYAEIVMPRKTTRPSRCITFHHAYIKYHINIKDNTKYALNIKQRKLYVIYMIIIMYRVFRTFDGAPT